MKAETIKSETSIELEFPSPVRSSASTMTTVLHNEDVVDSTISDDEEETPPSLLGTTKDPAHSAARTTTVPVKVESNSARVSLSPASSPRQLSTPTAGTSVANGTGVTLPTVVSSSSVATAMAHWRSAELRSEEP